MMVAIRHPGRCRPSERVLSMIVLPWIRPLSQSEWIRWSYFLFPCLCFNELCVVDYQCQGSDSYRGPSILSHCLDLGDYPRVSRNFLINQAFVRYVMFLYDGCCSSSRTVQTIGYGAFQFCSSLNSATISEWVNKMPLFFISLSML